MKLSEIEEALGLESVNGKPIDGDRTITHGYSGDLLSLVLANARAGDDTIWLTIQNHLNIIGVASLAGITAIVVCEGHEVPDDVTGKADEEGIAVFRSPESAFLLGGKLYERGIR
jgi:hypothetical protein